MKKQTIFIIIAILVSITCSVIGYTNGVNTNNYTTFTYSQLNEEIEKLKEEKLKLETSVDKLREEKGYSKYLITLRIEQTHFTLDLSEHLKDKMNEIEFDITVDKDYYDSVSIGSVISNDFRVGSLILRGSFGNWKVSVVDKQIVTEEE